MPGPSGSMPKRKSDELTIILAEDIGSVKWLRCTSSRLTSRKRESFTINLYSGSPDDDPPARASISGRTQLHVNIADSQFRTASLGAKEFAKQRIIETVKNAGM